jgi:hypothetical protein
MYNARAGGPGKQIQKGKECRQDNFEVERERYGGDLLQGEKRTALSCAEAKNKRRVGAERETN